MKIRNRLPAVLLTLVMIISMLPVSAFAENDPPTPTGQVEADPGSLSFGSVQQDYASISPKPVTIRNNTAANVMISSLGGLSYFEVTVMDANAQPLTLPHELSPGESMNIAVNPKNGLAEGDYNEKLTIVYNDGEEKTLNVALSFGVGDVAPQPSSYTVTVKADPPAGGTVTGGGKVNAGQEITVTATANNSYVFDGWYEGTVQKSMDASYKFTPVGDITLTAKFTPLNPVSYSVTGGADSIWTRGSGATLTVTVKRSPDDASCYSHFTGVEIDGTALVRDTDYTAAAGSTVVTLRAAALQKLSVGSHNVTVRFDDGKVSTGLTVKAAASSGNGASASKGTKTGDESDLALWSILMLLSAAAMIVLLLCARKRKIEK